MKKQRALIAVFFLSCFLGRLDLHATERLNVLFIAVDDLRPDLGCYGNTVVKSPHLDRLAARSVVFDRAYCQQAVCSPSRTAMLTGLRPDTTKVWDLKTHFRVAQPDCVTLPEHFRANGYHTAALSKIYHNGYEDGRSWSEPHWYPKGRSVDTDPHDWQKRIVTRHEINAEEYSNPITRDNAAPNSKDAKRGPAFEVSSKEESQLPDGATATEAERRLKQLKVRLQQSGEPFFLAVGFLKPHLPFVAPRKYWDLYDPDSIPGPETDRLPAGCPEFAGHSNGELHNYPGVPKDNPIPESYAKQLRHGYYACVSYVDAQIGRVLDALEREGLSDSTIVVLWGDHGWHLGDHGLWHKHTNFETATRSPLLIHVPGRKSAGRRCLAPVEFIDVYPTLAELCGLKVPSKIEGESLLDLLDNPDSVNNSVAISQYPRKDTLSGRSLMGYSIRTERWRATFWLDQSSATVIATELYDEREDPHETESLAMKPEHRELLESLAKHIPRSAWSARAGDGSASLGNTEPSEASKDSTNGERSRRFDKLDRTKSGRIALAEYTDQQSDTSAAELRFKKWDTDQDGYLSRDEFLRQGKQ
jgi:iduronate 2-sulfatase